MSFHYWIAREVARDRIDRLVREAERSRRGREARGLHRRRRLAWTWRWAGWRTPATVPQPRREADSA